MATDQDQTIGKLTELAEEASAAHLSFKRKVKALTDANPVIVQAVEELYSLVAEVTASTTQAHSDTVEWSNQVEDDIEMLKERLSPETQFLPDDAARLKGLLVALYGALQTATGVDAAVLAALGEQVTQAVTFIDENTLEEGAEDEDEDEDDADSKGEDDDEDEA